ncbi:MAG TPA: hypothetical protein VJZ04_01455 [Lachnospiraceae bacterium]|nr:hypothetical protein [Lachnospiraceae bacterium]
METVINQCNIIREVEDIDAMLESLEVNVTVNKATVEETNT